MEQTCNQKDGDPNILELNPPLPPLPKVQTSAKGVENAKKRLRAFSIQKKNPLAMGLSPTRPKPGTSGATVMIGKAASIKATVKAKAVSMENEELPKLPKPPKPGSVDTNSELKKCSIEEIEEMKRKMELADLGIPLGLIGPKCDHSMAKAMPTKAMPPIKNFLTKNEEVSRKTEKKSVSSNKKTTGRTEQLDEIIKEAKKAKAEGKAFDYKTMIPVLANPFQSQKKTEEQKQESAPWKSETQHRYHHGYKKSRDRGDKDKDRNDKDKHKDDRDKKHKRRDRESRTDKDKKRDKETDVNLNDYLVCDSWSLDTDEKIENSPHEVLQQLKKKIEKEIEITEKDETKDSVKDIVGNSKQAQNKVIKEKSKEGNEKLKPVVDSFTYEIDEDIDMFDKDTSIDKFAKKEGDRKPKTDDSQDGGDNDFLESVIAEIKQENMSGGSPEKGLVQYESPDKSSGYSTPDLSSKKSSESGYKSDKKRPESIRSTDDSFKMAEDKITTATDECMEMWSFVLKICQPLLFRHDRNKCYKETKTVPSLWYTENPKMCDCVKDRRLVYEELESCKSTIVSKVYGNEDATLDPEPTTKREWYTRLDKFLSDSKSEINLTNDWENEDSLEKVNTPVKEKTEDLTLDIEYQRFMDAVWPEITEAKSDSPKEKSKKRKIQEEEKNDQWSEDSEVEHKRTKKIKRSKSKETHKKRKHSPSSESDSSDEKNTKKISKKRKSKLAKRRKKEKKMMKKIKEKQKKKTKKLKEKLELESDDDKIEEKLKKAKKKSKLKQKRKEQKKRRNSTSSDSSSDSDKKKSKKKNKKKKKTKMRNSETENEEIFDINVLNNIKSEPEFSPRMVQKHRQIINMTEFDLSMNLEIKQEKDSKSQDVAQTGGKTQEVSQAGEKTQEIVQTDGKTQEDTQTGQIPQEVAQTGGITQEVIQTGKIEQQVVTKPQKVEIEVVSEVKANVEHKSIEKKIIPQVIPQPVPVPPPQPIKTINDESNSRTSQDSIKVDQITPEERKSEEIRPASPNSNYSFTDVLNSRERKTSLQQNEQVDNYEMYEQMALEYQNGVAQQGDTSAIESGANSHKIETLVNVGRGEIKCDWRPGDALATDTHRPSRWGMKAAPQVYPIRSVLEENTTTYKIESITNRTNESISYDEAYEDMYGASDRLQYGDCFNASVTIVTDKQTDKDHRRSLDDRIDVVLKETVLGDVAKEEAMEDSPQDKGILVTKPSQQGDRVAKRVSFADGFMPGQDSDTEAPPKKKRRRLGCAWPCPLGHPDHVPLWDALPPPPPPPDSPPPHLFHPQTHFYPHAQMAH